MTRDKKFRYAADGLQRQLDAQKKRNIESLRDSEQTVARIVVEDALYLGYSISVFDGEKTTLSQSRDMYAIFDAIGTTDEDRLKFYRGDKLVGMAWFIWGEEWTALTDYTDNAETRLILQRANDAIDQNI